MIWFIIAVIIAIVVWIKERSIWKGAVTFFIGCLTAIVIALTIRTIMPDQYEILREEEIIQTDIGAPYVSVMNISDSRSQNQRLVFTVIGKDDKPVTYKTDAKGVFGGSKIIVETNTIKPNYVRQKMRPIYEYWELFAINFGYF